MEKKERYCKKCGWSGSVRDMISITLYKISGGVHSYTKGCPNCRSVGIRKEPPDPKRKFYIVGNKIQLPKDRYARDVIRDYYREKKQNINT